MEITIDEMGNIFGNRPGKNNSLSPVMSGSHIDSQPKGGRFDGILGVMGALETLRVDHAVFDEKLVNRVLTSGKKLGYPTLQMISGAGHDASYMNGIGPTAMIFVASIGGRSHGEVEDTCWEDCEAGANVLFHAILQSANER